MFTGIVQGMGIVRSFARQGEDALLTVEVPFPISELKKGDSIAVNGVCLTVRSLGKSQFTADVSKETLSRTNLRYFRPGDRVNLETSARLSDFLGGHLVLGHVDGTGIIRERAVKSNSLALGFEVSQDLMRYIVEKGSVAVDGVSLTVNRCEKEKFYVNIIPHTAEVTTLGLKRIGDMVNIETDIIGKYVEKFIRAIPQKGIDWDFLQTHGMIDKNK